MILLYLYDINDNQFYNTILINLIQVLYSFLKKKKL